FSVWRNQRWDNQREAGNLPMLIEATQRKLGLIELDVAAVEPQSAERIEVELNGPTLRGAEAVGEALRDLVKAEKLSQRRAGGSAERYVGRFGGLALCIGSSREDAAPAFHLAGQCRYEVQAYQSGPALVVAMLAALDSVAEQRQSTRTQFAARQKRLEDLRIELERPFEHEARLTELLVRQRELLKRLDLDKDEAGTARADADEPRMAA
ncbi:MAG TPA: DEAD/DEAH box helicase, partial [Rubrivivax sp.]|nr:DEAD/DEAH box helicase [Rubrivivax sp.]